MPESVSVATYNLYLGADLSMVLGERPQEELSVNQDEVKRQLLATAFPERAAYVARSLVEHEVDLAGLQEVCCWTVSEQQVWDFTEIMLAALRECGADYEAVSEVATFAGDGVLPAESAVARGVPVAVRGSNVVLRRVGSPVQVLDEGHGLFETALGVSSFGTQEVAIARGWCGVRCEVDGRRFAFVNTHTEAYDPTSRNRQRDELMAACDRWSEDPLVLVGDFNAAPDQVGMPDGLVDAWTVNDHPGYTCCQAGDLRNEESQLTDRIDYVWVRGARVRSASLLGADRSLREVAGMWPSDHAGVHAVVDLDGPAG